MDTGTGGSRKRKAYTIKVKLEACEYAEKSSNEEQLRTLYIEKFITLVWQVDNVLIEAGSLIQAGGRSNLF